ncbi:unnamed protein product [Amoebophrya sp. A25]|nr:unnamed protein product [Amoebophrya sp. A25]|eukprot:GSA25T00017180001.1
MSAAVSSSAPVVNHLSSSGEQGGPGQSTQTPSSSSSAARQFFESFPPFFTLQPNAATRNKQLLLWQELVLAHCRQNKVYTVTAGDAIFHCRRLSVEGFEALCTFMVSQGRAELLPGGGIRVHVLTMRELADALYNFARDTCRLNSVETIYNLLEGDETTKQVFYGLPKESVLQALRLLNTERKAEILSVAEEGAEDGVKFFG